MVVFANRSLQDLVKPEKSSDVPPLTRLLCTLGPNLYDVDDLAALMSLGMKVARIDLTWASTEWAASAMRNVRAAEAKSGCVCAIALDTNGPEISVLNVPPTSVSFKAGSHVIITCDRHNAFSSVHVPIDYELELGHSGLQNGTTIFIDKYLATGDDVQSLALTAIALSNREIVCVAQRDCEFPPGALLHVHISNMRNEKPILSAGDKTALTALRELGPDFVMCSFTRTEHDVAEARAFLQEAGMEGVQLIAKIENAQGLVNHRAIIDASDAIVVSRGRLGIDLPAEKVFLAQKRLIKAANLAGKTVLATRVVDTMVHAPRPTRAEATDVANLVLDGVDGILLGLETFSGVNPANAARTVLAICKQAELCFDHMDFYSEIMDSMGGFEYANLTKPEALASSAVRATQKLNARLILAFTITGRTPRLVSKYRADVPILAVIAPSDQSAASKARCVQITRQSQMLRGVIPVIADTHAEAVNGHLATDGSLTDWAADTAVQQGLVCNGDRIIVMQCPRIMQGLFTEAGVVKFCVVGDRQDEGKQATAGKNQNGGALLHVGSICDLSGMKEG